MTRSDLARLDLPAAALRAALVCLDLADEAGGEPFAVSAGIVADRAGMRHRSAAALGLRTLIDAGLVEEVEHPRGPSPGRYLLATDRAA